MPFTDLYEKLLSQQAKLAIIGLGYVGLPLVTAFSTYFNVIGYDIDCEKVNNIKASFDDNTNVEFTCDENKLSKANFFIVAVPTPVSSDKIPDLTPIITAFTSVGKNLSIGSVVVLESTVYPGVTEDICLPILQKESSLIGGIDFKIGYSPERINPADKIHTISTITKIVSGMDNETLDIIASVYQKILHNKPFRAKSIKVAEAAKLAENTQRDVNIAFMNELSIAFNYMGINTNDVLEAMATKWNALGFKPGLVGGHCIGVDPYYFIYKAQMMGYNTKIINVSRIVNDYMSEFIVNCLIKELIKSDKNIKSAKIYIFGITFKENCPDFRNSQSAVIVDILKQYDIEAIVVDTVADKTAIYKHMNITLCPLSKVNDADAIIFAVAHNEFSDITPKYFDGFFSADGARIVMDIKSMFNKADLINRGYRYWSL